MTKSALHRQRSWNDAVLTGTDCLVSVKLHLRDERTDARNRIWCVLALKCDIWWQWF